MYKTRTFVAAQVVDPAAVPLPQLPRSVLLTPRAAVLRATAEIRAAEIASSPYRRARLLATADFHLAAALAGRPGWSEAYLAQAYLAVVKAGRVSLRAVDAYQHSYAQAPFLAPAAYWRIRFGIAAWPMLDSATQAHMIDEAAWAAARSSRARAQFDQVLLGTPAATQYQARLAEVTAAG